ncbi:MAG: VOC family protein [candidate division Zixibacteria bacterium]|nr:VOC family protein [candidate division Zixibacteria bacterium]
MKTVLFVTLMVMFAGDSTFSEQQIPEQIKGEDMVTIDKITIAVEKIEETVKFYNAILELELKSYDVEGNKLYGGKFGEIELLFCPKSFAGIEADENTIQLRFVVPDIKKSMEKGVRSGGTVMNEIYEHEGVSYSSLRDPDGNSLELIQK